MINTAIKLFSGMIVLDIGCGPATFIEPSFKHMAEVIGLDLDLKLLKIARDNNKSYLNFHCLLADASHLPIRRDAIDGVSCGEVAEHLRDPISMIKDIYYCLKSGGGLIITTPNKVGSDELGRGLLTKLRYIRHRYIRKNRASKKLDHLNVFTYGTLIKTLTSIGFKINEVKSQGMGINNILYKLGIRPLLPVVEIIITEKLPNQVQRGWIIACSK